MVKFEIYLGVDRLYHWRLKAANGEIVCWAEAYSTHAEALQSVNWVKHWAPIAPVYNV